MMQSMQTIAHHMFEALTFDDVFLVPYYSEITSEEVDLSSSISEGVRLNIPILSVAQASLNETMVGALSLQGGMGIVHHQQTAQQQVEAVNRIKSYYRGPLVGASVHGDKESLARIDLLANHVDLLVIDSPHAHSRDVLAIAKEIRCHYPELPLVVGNISSPEAALNLAEVDVHAVKVGFGFSDKERLLTGVGMPQLTAIMRIYKVLQGSGIRVIAEGGIRYPGDIVKALAAGADCVALGGMFMGCKEMSHVDSYGDVPLYQGTLQEVLHTILSDVRRGMQYLGASTIENLKRRARFCRVTPYGRREYFL